VTGLVSGTSLRIRIVPELEKPEELGGPQDDLGVEGGAGSWRTRGTRDPREARRRAPGKDRRGNLLTGASLGSDPKPALDHGSNDHDAGTDYGAEKEPEVIVPAPDELAREEGTKGAERLGDREEDRDRLRAHLEGEISLTVRYSALARVDTKKKMTHQNAVWPIASRRPARKSTALRARRLSEIM